MTCWYWFESYLTKTKKDIYLGNIVHGIDFDPIKNLHVIIQCPVDTDLNHIWKKQKIYLSREYRAWNRFWSYQNFARDYSLSCWYWFESYMTKTINYFHLANIVHGIDFDPIKNLNVTIQWPVDTDSNHIRQKQKRYLSREYSAWNWFWSFHKFACDYSMTCWYWFESYLTNTKKIFI